MRAGASWGPGFRVPSPWNEAICGEKSSTIFVQRLVRARRSSHSVMSIEAGSTVGAAGIDPAAPPSCEVRPVQGQT
jgi:hypothetical protein